jgi:hypothetical protein
MELLICQVLFAGSVIVGISLLISIFFYPHDGER